MSKKVDGIYRSGPCPVWIKVRTKIAPKRWGDRVTATVEFPTLDEFLAGHRLKMITAEQQELFDSLVSQHDGADKLSRLDLEKIFAIVKTTEALRKASGPDVPRIAGTLIKLSEELRRVVPKKPTGRLIN